MVPVATSVGKIHFDALLLDQPTTNEFKEGRFLRSFSISLKQGTQLNENARIRNIWLAQTFWYQPWWIDYIAFLSIWIILHEVVNYIHNPKKFFKKFMIYKDEQIVMVFLVLRWHKSLDRICFFKSLNLYISVYLAFEIMFANFYKIVLVL